MSLRDPRLRKANRHPCTLSHATVRAYKGRNQHAHVDKPVRGGAVRRWASPTCLSTATFPWGNISANTARIHQQRGPVYRWNRPTAVLHGRAHTKDMLAVLGKANPFGDNALPTLLHGIPPVAPTKTFLFWRSCTSWHCSVEAVCSCDDSQHVLTSLVLRPHHPSPPRFLFASSYSRW